MSDSATLWTAACKACLSFTTSRSLLKLMSIELVMPSNQLIFCWPLLLFQLFPASVSFPVSWNFVPSGQNTGASAFSPSNEYSAWIFFRIDWSDLLAVQGTLKGLLQHQFQSINSSTLSLPYDPTLTPLHNYWKNHSFD